jgi:ABC-type uncharacterized transport system auxiliary subunit
MNNPHSILLPLLACAVLAATGCFSLAGLSQDPPAKRHYLLAAAPAPTTANGANHSNAPAEAASTEPGDAALLQVNKAYVAAPYHEKSLVYRIAKDQYSTDYYHEFLVSPAQMVTQLTVDWLQKSRAWPRVHHSGQAAGASRVLDLNVLELYGDYQEAKSPAAVVRLRVTLWSVNPEDGAQRSLYEKDYAARVDVADREASTLVAGFNEALAQVLGEMAADLRKQRE